MQAYISQFLVVYFSVFLFLTVFWRSWVLYKSTGVNALALKDKTGAEARTHNSFAIVVIGTAVFLALVYFFPQYQSKLKPIVFLHLPLIQLVGMALMLVALLWIVIAQIQMGTSWRIGTDEEVDTQLVIKGLFRYSRNPIYLGMVLCVMGLFFTLPNLVTLIIMLSTIFLIRSKIKVEEQHLLKTFGSDYQQYCTQVRRWI